jgi:PEP-CTERM motif
MRLRILVALFALLASGVTAKADPITVTVSDSAWVTTPNVAPYDTYYPNVTVTFTGDTSNLVYNSTGYIGTEPRGVPIYGEPYYYIPGTATIQIGSLGTFTFDDPTEFFVNQNYGNQGVAIAGIALFNGDVILATQNAAFSSYTGSTSIGPLSGPVSPLDIGFDTSDGFTVLLPSSYSGADGAPSTLTASVDTAPAPTPEPSSLALLGTGILGFAATIRRRLR